MEQKVKLEEETECRVTIISEERADWKRTIGWIEECSENRIDKN